MKDKLIAEERMKQFDKDVLHWKDYDYVIINNDLENYKKIIPCGISDKGVTNLKNILDQDYSNLSDILIKNFISNLKI